MTSESCYFAEREENSLFNSIFVYSWLNKYLIDATKKSNWNKFFRWEHIFALCNEEISQFALVKQNLFAYIQTKI